ncbi:hypothetical protein TKK_0016551 [Trichogramma kaykai]
MEPMVRDQEGGAADECDEEELGNDNLTRQELYLSIVNPPEEEEKKSSLKKYIDKFLNIVKNPLGLNVSEATVSSAPVNTSTENSLKNPFVNSSGTSSVNTNTHTVNTNSTPITAPGVTTYNNPKLEVNSGKKSLIKKVEFKQEDTFIANKSNSISIMNQSEYEEGKLIKSLLENVGKFNATGGRNTTQFIRDILNAAREIPFSLHRKFILRLRNKMEGPRAQNIDIGRFVTISQLTNYLNENYGYNKSPTVLMSEMSRMSQGEFEKVIEFYERMLEMRMAITTAYSRNNMTSFIDEAYFIETFKLGLKPEITLQMHPVGSLEAACSEAQRIERIITMQREIRNHNTGEIRCVFCSSTSHSSLDCEIFKAIKNINKPNQIVDSAFMQPQVQVKENKVEKKEPEVITINKIDAQDLCQYCRQPGHAVNNCISYWNSINQNNRGSRNSNNNGYNNRNNNYGNNNNYNNNHNNNGNNRNNNGNSNNSNYNNGNRNNNYNNNGYSNNNQRQQIVCHNCQKKGGNGEPTKCPNEAIDFEKDKIECIFANPDSPSPTIEVTGNTFKGPIKLMIDTGAGVSLIKRSKVKDWVKINKTNIWLKGITDKLIKSSGSITGCIFDNTLICMQIVEDDFPITQDGLLGTKSLKDCRTNINYETSILKLDGIEIPFIASSDSDVKVDNSLNEINPSEVLTFDIHEVIEEKIKGALTKKEAELRTTSHIENYIERVLSNVN